MGEPEAQGDPATRGRWPRREAIVFGAAFGLVYATLAVWFHQQTPRLFEHLDQLFDADLGLWVIDLARPQGPHTPTSVHPLFLLFFKPLGTALRGLLKLAGVGLAARLASGLLCAVAGGAAVGAFRVLLHRLGVPAFRARPWTVVFALSATQLVFSSLPESFAFSALSLILVFVLAAGPRPAGPAAVAAGVFSYGITFTNLGAVVLARASGFRWPQEARRGLRAVGRHVGLVLLVAAVLAVLQWFVYPRARPFFVPEVPGAAYQKAFIRSADPAFLGFRAGEVASHLLFIGLASPHVTTRETHTARVVTDYAPWALARPRVASGLHMALWIGCLVLAVRGLRHRSAPLPPLVTALGAWLCAQAVLHFIFGTSLFLYSGHWVFALVAFVAAGLEEETAKGARWVAAGAWALALLQGVANGALLLDVLEIYSGR